MISAIDQVQLSHSMSHRLPALHLLARAARSTADPASVKAK
jgi:hypothetical protein